MIEAFILLYVVIFTMNLIQNQIYCYYLQTKNIVAIITKPLILFALLIYNIYLSISLSLWSGYGNHILVIIAPFWLDDNLNVQHLIFRCLKRIFLTIWMTYSYALVRYGWNENSIFCKWSLIVEFTLRHQNWFSMKNAIKTKQKKRKNLMPISWRVK